MENERARTRGIKNTSNMGSIFQAVRLEGAVHWWHFEMEVKILPCKIKETRMRRCFLILYF